MLLLLLHATCYTDTKIYSQRDDGRGNVYNNSGTTNPYIPSTTQSHDTNTNKKQIHVRADGPHKYIFHRSLIYHSIKWYRQTGILYTIVDYMWAISNKVVLTKS